MKDKKYNATLTLGDDNRNGRITCAEARAHGIAPAHRTFLKALSSEPEQKNPTNDSTTDTIP